MCELKHTIKFTFSKGAEKPNIGEVAAFVKALNADHNAIEAAYRMAEEKSLYIKFKSEESMVHALTVNSDDLIFHYVNGKKAKVYMSHAQEYVFYVRVYDLLPEIPDQEIELVLEKFGKVKRVVREKFPAELGLDAYTGVRGVYIDVKREIPTSLHFLNRKGNIFYPGNKDKCFLCKEEGHRIIACPKRKARKQSGEVGNSQEKEQRSYAGAVSGAQATVGGGPTVVAVAGEVQSDGSRQETIEVIEEEMPETAMGPMVAEISENETSEDENLNHPLYKLASHLAVHIKQKNEQSTKSRPVEFRKTAEDEEAKIKSPPRKKKNFSLYNK